MEETEYEERDEEDDYEGVEFAEERDEEDDYGRKN